MIVFGLAAVIAPCMGKLMQIITQIPIFVLYYSGIIGIFTALLLWKRFSETYVLFLFGIAFSIIESINTTQTRG